MAVDNTHTKYLHGADEKAWKNYADAYKAQKSFENFMESIDKAGGEKDAKTGRRDIPINKNKKNK